MRILVVDDDPELAELVSHTLSRDGHRLTTASDLASAQQALAEQGADLLVLDVGLPDGSGLTLCRDLRAADSEIPILLLTAKSAVSQRVEGLDAGADDFVAKPFAVAELRARVRALARRRARAPIDVRVLGDVELDVGRRRAHRDGLEAELTAREWDILEALAARNGRVVSRDVLLAEVWGETGEATASSLEVLIGRIRRKLGKHVVRTLRGSGYALG